jgi:hypothetical protein
MKKEMAKKNRNEVINKMEEGTLATCQKVSLFGGVGNMSLWRMLGSLLQMAM